MGLGKAGQGIHEQQHMLALVAKILGNRRGHTGAMHAHHRGIIRRDGHHHGAGQALFPEDVIDEFFYLAATLTDQTDHDHIGGVPCHHPE